MTCESCKGTRRITLAYSVVECLDCAKPASLPAAPMAKCAAPCGFIICEHDGNDYRYSMEVARELPWLADPPIDGSRYYLNQATNMYHLKDTI
jgi:hypothetical protein